jgi:fibrillarin-like rRNA methylase
MLLFKAIWSIKLYGFNSGYVFVKKMAEITPNECKHIFGGLVILQLQRNVFHVKAFFHLHPYDSAH